MSEEFTHMHANHGYIGAELTKLQGRVLHLESIITNVQSLVQLPFLSTMMISTVLAVATIATGGPSSQLSPMV